MSVSLITSNDIKMSFVLPWRVIGSFQYTSTFIISNTLENINQSTFPKSIALLYSHSIFYIYYTSQISRILTLIEMQVIRAIIAFVSLQLSHFTRLFYLNMKANDLIIKILIL